MTGAVRGMLDDREAEAVIELCEHALERAEDAIGSVDDSILRWQDRGLLPSRSDVWPTGPGSLVVGAQDVGGWSDSRAVFSVPAGLAPGSYALWVLHAGWGPWSEVGRPS